ncbi:hypothetical protein BHE74_00016011 [Ensete ventricosum]|nr:hypothetical protein BHE74_00016011 [Ensete ventricosum]
MGLTACAVHPNVGCRAPAKPIPSGGSTFSTPACYFQAFASINRWLFLQTIGSFVITTVSLFRPLAPVCEEAAAAAADSHPEAAAAFCRSFWPCGKLA